MTSYPCNDRDATEIICAAFDGDPARIAASIARLRTWHVVTLPYGCIARLAGKDGEWAAYWPVSPFTRRRP